MTRKGESLCWAIGIAGMVIALRLTRAAPAIAAPAPITAPNVRAASLDDAETLDSIANLAVQQDPFRLARRPSQVAFVADTAAEAARVARAPVAPPLVLAGIVGGPPWAAVIEGIPGRPAAVVLHRGDTVAGLRIRDVKRDRAVVSSTDTTWVLTIKRTWQ